MFSLQDYRTKKNEILANDKLSQKGKDDALAKLERQFKDDARKSVKSLRKEAVINALTLKDAQEKRFSLVEKAQATVDYARLNYEAQAAASRIKASESLSDVLEVWDSVKGSGDAYAIKAFKETSQGLISEKFGDDFTDLKGSLFDDMRETEVELVKVEMSDDEIKAQEALRDIQAQANEINEVFGSGQAVVKRVFDGVAFDDGKIELGFDYEIHKLTDVKETKSEVALRLERERQENVDAYEKMLKDKNFEGRVDGDFDDFQGVF